jgi:hypothetical protein
MPPIPRPIMNNLRRGRKDEGRGKREVGSSREARREEEEGETRKNRNIPVIV